MTLQLLLLLLLLEVVVRVAAYSCSVAVAAIAYSTFSFSSSSTSSLVNAFTVVNAFNNAFTACPISTRRTTKSSVRLNWRRRRIRMRMRVDLEMEMDLEINLDPGVIHVHSQQDFEDCEQDKDEEDLPGEVRLVKVPYTDYLHYRSEEKAQNEFLQPQEDNYDCEFKQQVFCEENKVEEAAIASGNETSDLHNSTSNFALGLIIMTSSLPPTAPRTTKGKGQALQKRDSLTQQTTGTPFVVDFVRDLYYNPNPRRPGKDVLLQAVGRPKGWKNQNRNQHKNNKNHTNENDWIVLDLTAGWGRDAMALLRSNDDVDHYHHHQNPASARTQVILVERQPVVAQLVRDALRRLQKYEDARLLLDHDPQQAQQHTNCNYSSRLTLIQGDAVQIFANHSTSTPTWLNRDRPHVVYVDPMYPPRTKSASVQKRMQILHALTVTATDPAQDLELEALLRVARQLATHRVVVKRPIRASVAVAASTANTNSSKPTYSLVAGRRAAHRWDCYVIQ